MTTSDPHDQNRLGWWSISGVALLEALKQVERGARAGDVFDRIYLGSDHYDVPRKNSDDGTKDERRL